VLGQPAAVRYAVADDIDGKLTPVILEKARWDTSGLDFAQFTLVTTEKYSLVKLGDEHDAHIGDATIAVHFSSGIAKQVSHGQISSDVAAAPSCDSEYVGCDLGFILQEYAAPGGSGSCVISEDTHEVIGILVFEFQSRIGFVVEPISRFKEFLALPNQERKPSAAAVQHGLTEEQEKILEEVLKNLPQY
jgi:S1-C subfamily serine protease